MRALPVASPDGKSLSSAFRAIPSVSGPQEHSRPEPRKTAGSICRWPNSLHGVGVRPSTVEVAVNGSSEEVNSVIGQLAGAMPTADVRPVRQIVEGEARVLGKTRATLYAAAVLIILTAALCVLATLTGWVFDRRRDFAIMKALGASERLVSAFFAAEAAALGAVGALLGFVVGIGIAAWIGRVNFNAPVVPRLSVLPFVWREHGGGATVGYRADVAVAARTACRHPEGRVKVIKLKGVSRLYPARAEENGGVIRGPG